MARRAAVIIDRPCAVADDVTKGKLLNLIYSLLSAGDPALAKYLHSGRPGNKFKPFTFGCLGDDPRNLTIYFASADETATEALVAGGRALMGNGILQGDNLCVIRAVVPISDLRYFPGALNVRTVSPIVLSRRGEDGKKRYLLYPQDTGAWLSGLRDNLIKRVAAFTSCVPEPRDVVIDAIGHGRGELVEFQNSRIPARHMELRIRGSKAVLETAVYAGLGERTGSGFGMVVPF